MNHEILAAITEFCENRPGRVTLKNESIGHKLSQMRLE